jgi:hypothetical protein
LPRNGSTARRVTAESTLVTAGLDPDGPARSRRARLACVKVSRPPGCGDAFQVLSRNNTTPGRYDQGRKDPVELHPAEEVEIITRDRITFPRRTASRARPAGEYPA